MKIRLLGPLLCTSLFVTAVPFRTAEAVPIARDLSAYQLVASPNPFLLDIELDGTSDLQFWSFVNSSGPQADVFRLDSSLEIWRYEPVNNFAAALPAPTAVSGYSAADADLFEPDAPVTDHNPWLALNGLPAYFGGLLTISGDPHQFWVRMSVDPNDGALTFYEVGYDTDVYQAAQIPNVPEPSTLSLLAIGVVALAYRSRAPK